ncbi:hypothetical protein [Pseudomonas sp. G2-4]|uniref:hypothetical protein n=1 Tax=Pseudomonas sp. G2-4 TaxID=1506334 RepID=UPI0024BBB975|nr:hypothetical protein [Pseudomonas sp. G2-4]WHS57681.1 hypothetical protein QNH97_14430 [Pseudomonas sp. G2-4]
MNAAFEQGQVFESDYYRARAFKNGNFMFNDADLKVVQKALAIAGPEDFTSDGGSGVVTVYGEFADSILRAKFPNDDARARLGLKGRPVRIARGSHLEIWCDGFYMEGAQVRGIVHRAAQCVLPQA